MTNADGRNLVMTSVAIMLTGLLLNLLASSAMPSAVQGFAKKITSGYGV